MPLKLSTPQFARKAGLQVGRFFAWWRGELAAAWTDWSLRKGGRAQILCDDVELVLSRITSSGSEIVARVPSGAALTELPGLIQTLLNQPERAFRKLEIVLPAEAVLSRRIHLPAAVGSRVREAVGFQLERLMPLKAELVYYGCRVAAREEGRRRLQVEVVAARRNLADDIIAHTLAAGVHRVSLASAADTAARGTVSIVEKAGLRLGFLDSRIDRGLAWGAAALALTCAVVMLGQYHAENSRLATRVAALKQQAAAADKLRDALQARVDRIRFLANRVEETDNATVLAELTRLLPSDAWVFQFQADGDQLHLAGFAKDASALSAQLSKSAMFSDVSLRSAVKAPGEDAERFDIAIRVKTPVPS